MNILGVNCFSHDTAAALLQDGEPVAFVEEERFNREKHTKEFPDRAIEFCLREAGISIRDIDAVAFAHRAGLDLRRGMADLLRRLPRSARNAAAQPLIDLNLVRKQQAFVRRWGYRGRVVNVGHHEAHAASAFFASGFDEAAVLTLDRGGDWLSTTLGHGRGRKLRTLAEVRNPDSLGEVYTSLTWYLGFHPNADEGKVMGLAPYGRDTLVPDFRHPASGDAGNALGAALYAWHQVLGHPRGWRMEHAFYGPDREEAEMKEAIAARGLSFREVSDPAEEAARLLAASKIVGWFQGR